MNESHSTDDETHAQSAAIRQSLQHREQFFALPAAERFGRPHYHFKRRNETAEEWQARCTPKTPMYDIESTDDEEDDSGRDGDLEVVYESSERTNDNNPTARKTTSNNEIKQSNDAKSTTPFVIPKSFTNASSSSRQEQPVVVEPATARHKTVDNFEFGGYLGGNDGRKRLRQQAAPYDVSSIQRVSAPVPIMRSTHQRNQRHLPDSVLAAPRAVSYMQLL